jgi:hypothetical protein
MQESEDLDATLWLEAKGFGGKQIGAIQSALLKEGVVPADWLGTLRGVDDAELVVILQNVQSEEVRMQTPAQSGGQHTPGESASPEPELTALTRGDSSVAPDAGVART